MYTDADVDGPVVDALVRAGWDVERAVDTFAEGTDDGTHFAHAAATGRVVVSNDLDMKRLAEAWYAEGRVYAGLVWWSRRHYATMSPGDFVSAFDELADTPEPFLPYQIVHLKPRHSQ